MGKSSAPGGQLPKGACEVGTEPSADVPRNHVSSLA